MVNVTHHRHYRRTMFLCTFAFAICHHRFFQLVLTSQRKLVAHLFTDDSGSFLVDHLVNGRHSAHFHHHFDDFRCFHSHLGSQFGYSDRFTNLHFTLHRLRWLIKTMLHAGWGFLFLVTISAVKCVFIVGVVFFLGFAHWRFFAMTTTTTLIA